MIDADGAVGARREQFEHAAGPRAEIEQAADRPVADHRQDRRLDPALRRVQRADRVPVGGALGEIGRRLLAPRFARRRQPGAVGGEGRVGGIDAGDQRARQRAAGVGEPIERPGAFALALGEAGFDQQFQMPRDARLRLAENGDELADRQLGLAEQADQPEARHLARRLQARQQGVEAQRRRTAGRRGVRHKDMLISDFRRSQGRPRLFASRPDFDPGAQGATVAIFRRRPTWMRGSSPRMT